MPIQLTTPMSMGDIDDDYTHVKIIKFEVNLAAQVIEFRTAHGFIDAGDFVLGQNVGQTTRKRFELNGPDFASIITKQTSAAGVLIYDEVARELYQWLIDNGHFAGTIV